MRSTIAVGLVCAAGAVVLSACGGRPISAPSPYHSGNTSTSAPVPTTAGQSNGPGPASRKRLTCDAAGGVQHPSNCRSTELN